MRVDDVPVQELVEGLSGGPRVRHSPYYECREAAHWLGIPWEAWEALGDAQRALHVAHYRVHHQLRAVLSQQAARRPLGGKA